ncbi:hypothetical protein HAX54_004520 [Datura stramonium]|uniref:Uncharacterized protein n=1 Tax=Datura stramonium TaxID=4076 RepID=A0ABS8RUK4_DATST|nr:hypothetical protein [Datura stramonium]
MDFDYAHYMLIEGRKGKEHPVINSSSREAYKKQLAETFNMNRTCILAFKNKPPTPIEAIPNEFASVQQQTKAAKSRQYIPQRTLDAPDIMDDYYLNLLNWDSNNVLSIALGGTVYLWDASDGAASELVTIDEENGPITSVKLAPDSRRIVVGLNNSEVQLWDTTTNRLICFFKSSNFEVKNLHLI